MDFIRFVMLVVWFFLFKPIVSNAYLPSFFLLIKDIFLVVFLFRDWYNLEKSKRVKPFRCGDFDDCIHKAESAQGMPPKKREKYARREDAILHALELERELLRKEGNLAMSAEVMNRQNSKHGAVKKDVFMPSESLGKEYSKLGNSKLNQLYKRKDLSHMNDIIGSPLSSQRLKEGNQLSGEDDHFEVTPRMRGLQDFGLKIASSKRKISSSSSLNGFWKPAADSTVEPFAHGGLGLGGTSHVNGNNYIVLLSKFCRIVHSPCNLTVLLFLLMFQEWSRQELFAEQRGVNVYTCQLTLVILWSMKQLLQAILTYQVPLLALVYMGRH